MTSIFMSTDKINTDAWRGRLTIFFGAAPGVGTTTAMLLAAGQARRGGLDVVVGAADTHGRAETEALLHGLERLPPQQVEVRGKVVDEFDLDGALTRRPALLVIDDLGHVNASGSHRWHDVDRLLTAGIDVMATLCVQNLESMHDAASPAAAIRKRELVPDALFDRAEVEFVDTPVDEVIARWQGGKISVQEQEVQIAEAMYRKRNLLDLREQALQRMEQRMPRESAIRRSGSRLAGGTSEKILVCVDASPLGPRLVSAAARMARELRAEWLALYVETPRLALASEAVRAQVRETMRQAEARGGEPMRISGTRIDREILAVARQRGVTKLIIGKPSPSHWRRWWGGSLVDAVIRDSGDLDVRVIAGDGTPRERPMVPVSPARASVGPYFWSALAVTTIAALLVLLVATVPQFSGFYAVLGLIVTVALIGSRFGRGPALCAVVVSCIAVELMARPAGGEQVFERVERLLIGVMLLATAWHSSGLAERGRRQAEAAQIDEHRLTALYKLSSELARTMSDTEIAECASRHVKHTVPGQVVILQPVDDKLAPLAPTDADLIADPTEFGTANEAFDRGRAIGRSTDTLPNAQALYLPLTAAGRTIGVLGVAPDQPQQLVNPALRQLLDAMTGPIALALQRVHLADEANRAKERAREEELRGSLLSSVSHDLRTPLASITGAASTILQNEAALGADVRRDLTQTIYDEAERLGRLVTNLLDMTRLETGTVTLRTDWVSLEDTIGSALTRLERKLAGRDVQVSLAPDLPLLALDEVLFEQMILNLLENACKYTPADSPIRIAAKVLGGRVVVEVADRGPGLPAGKEEKIFDKFYRVDKRVHGFGLGLAICRAIAVAHGGTITAENRPGGGSVFRITLPIGAGPPEPAPEASITSQRSISEARAT